MTPPLIKRFLIAYSEHKLLSWLILTLIAGASIILAIGPESKAEKSYKAVAKLSFSEPPPMFTIPGQQSQLQARMLVNPDLLLSSKLLEGVADRVKGDPKQLAKILKDVEIVFPEQEVNVPQNQLISLEYKGSIEREQAQLILKALMEEMVEYSRWLNSYQLQERINALQERLNVVEKDLNQAQESFYQYLTHEGSSLLSVQNGSLFNSITDNQTQQREIRVILQELDIQIDSIVQQLGLTPQQAHIATILSSDPIMAKLRTQILENEARIEQLKTELRPEHPSMVELLTQQQINEKFLEKRAEELIGESVETSLKIEEIRENISLDVVRQELANRLLTLEKQKESLNSQLVSLVKIEKELLQEYEEFPDKQLEQVRLAQEVESKRILYETLLTALTDSQGAEVETVSSLVIVQEPYLIGTTSSKSLIANPLLMVAGGMTLGGLTVVGVLLLLASVDDRLHTPRELKEILGKTNLPLLGQVPVIINDTSHQLALTRVKEANSMYLAFYEGIRSKIESYSTESLKLILVTSINPKEGKSTTAYNLAIASAQKGKRTLLLEVDFSCGSSESIQSLPGQENLYYLSTTGLQKQDKLLREARHSFDLIIVDAPCLSSYHQESLLLEPLSDGVILVTRPGISQKSLLNATLDQFREDHIPLLGAVINYVEGLNPWSRVETEDYLEDLSDWAIRELN